MIKLFKIFESRSANLSEDEFIELLNQNCKDYIDNPKILIRNKERYDYEYSFIDPSKSVRNAYKQNTDSYAIAAGTNTNHNLLLMDNLPSWRNFPKRSKSLIGTTSKNTSSLFGNFIYLVIPYDDVNFGVAPGPDLWSSNVDTYYKDQKHTIKFDSIFAQCFSDLYISDESFNDMISDIQNLYDRWITEEIGLVNKIRNIFTYIKDNNLTVLDGLNKILSPENFYVDNDDYNYLQGYSLEGYKDMYYQDLLELKGNHEFWTDGKCLLFFLKKTYDQKTINECYEEFYKTYIAK